MSARPNLLVIAGVVIVAGTGFALYARSAGRTANAALAAHTLARDELAGKHRDAETRRFLVEQTRAHAPIMLAIRHLSWAPGGPPDESSLPPGDVVRMRASRDPHLQQLELRAQGASTRRIYAALFTELKLAPETIERVEILMAQRGERNVQLSTLARTRLVPVDEPPLATLRRQSEEIFQSALTRLLGTEGWQAFERYARSVTVREYVDRFAGAAAVAGHPITAEQANRLMTLLLAANQDYQAGGASSLLAIDWDHVFTAAADILPPPPFHVFKSMSTSHQTRQRLQELAKEVGYDTQK